MEQKNISALRELFPILSKEINGRALVYFDNAATTQKPKSVINAYQYYYQYNNANVHRAGHDLSANATALFEHSREQVRNFIKAKSIKEIIWTKGTTESINLVAQSWAMNNLKAEDEIILSHAEHHANIVPWQQVADEKGVFIRVVELESTGKIDVNHFKTLLNKKTKLVCLHHISNVIGKVNDINLLISLSKNCGAKVLIDAAQSISQTEINVQQLDCDFLVFSAHKLYGPTGLGVLYGKHEILENMPPYQLGGEMIDRVSLVTPTTFNDLPFKFEAGTPNIAAVIAFNKAIDFVKKFKLNNYHTSKKDLIKFTYQELLKIPGLAFVTQEQPDVPIFSFIIDNIHPQDLAVYLDAYGIAVRVGHHCAMPLMDYLNINGCIRMSLAPYNSQQEVAYTISIIQQFIEQQDVGVEGIKDNILMIPETDLEQEMINLFEKTGSWDVKHRQIMLLGKVKCNDIDSIRVDDNLVNGCESSAWIKVSLDSDNYIDIIGHSDAKVIRGLIAIIKAAYVGKSPQQVLDFDINHYFNKLGLIKHLSPSRSNGLRAIVTKIQLEAQLFIQS